jgi:hypothetical protein
MERYSSRTDYSPVRNGIGFGKIRFNVRSNIERKIEAIKQLEAYFLSSF